MIKKTMDYVSPKTEVLVVQTEGVVCESNTGVMSLIWSDNPNSAGAGFSGDSIKSYGDDF